MKQKPYKFKLGEYAYIVGVAGINVITGRGHCEFHSGGTQNFYSLEGSHGGFHSEVALLKPSEARKICKEATND
jgi:hypothetical protein